MTTWTVPEIDWLSFGEAVARPKMPHLDEARAVAREAAGRPRRVPSAEFDAAASAWEALTTRLDAVESFDDPRRVFLPYADVVPRRTGPAVADVAPANASGAPLSVEMAVAFAALGRKTTSTAEALALEAARRVRPWSRGAPTRVGWVLVDQKWRAASNSREWKRDPLHAPVVVAMLPINSPSGGAAESWAERSRGEYGAQMRHLYERLRREGRWPEVSRTVRTARGPFTESSAPPGSIHAFVNHAAPLRFSASRKDREPHLEFLRRASDFADGWWHWRWLAAEGATADNSYGPYYDYYFPEGVAGRPIGALPDALDPLLKLYGLGLLPIDLRGDVVIVGVFNNFAPVTARSWAALKKRQAAAHGEVT